MRQKELGKKNKITNIWKLNSFKYKHLLLQKIFSLQKKLAFSELYQNIWFFTQAGKDVRCQMKNHKNKSKLRYGCLNLRTFKYSAKDRQTLIQIIGIPPVQHLSRKQQANVYSSSLTVGVLLVLPQRYNDNVGKENTNLKDILGDLKKLLYLYSHKSYV